MQKLSIVRVLLAIVLVFTVAADIMAQDSAETETPTDPTLVEALERAQAGVSSNAEWEEWYPEGFVWEFDGVPMVLVPVGCFMMGSTDEEVDAAMAAYEADTGRTARRSRFADEQPIHEQCIDEPFWIDKYEVSQEQMANFGERRDYFVTGDDLPASLINWFDSRDFCRRRDAELPTEVQWEYAARGVDSLIYPWGNEFDTSLLNSVNDTTCNSSECIDSIDGYSQHAPVTAFAEGQSWVGAYQMSGNVDEWVFSEFQPYPYDATDGRDEDNDNRRANIFRVMRGGSHIESAHGNRAVDRNRQFAQNNGSGTGFRCVHSHD